MCDVFGRWISRNLTHIDGIDLQPLAHFFQARPGTQAELKRKRIGLSTIDVIPQVRRDHGQPAFAVARVDDQAERLVDPFGLLLGTEIVQYEQLGFENGLEHIKLRHLCRIPVGVTNQLQQLADFVEDGMGALSNDRLFHQRNREVRLADTCLAVEKKALVNDGKLLNHADGILVRHALRVRVDLEVTELAMGVAVRNARVLD